jgi:hypothetical protein
MKCGIKRNIVWLFERHKPSPRPNTIIWIKVISVTISKHSVQDTEQACCVICTLLETLKLPKLRYTPWRTWTRSTNPISVRFYLWVFRWGFPVSITTTRSGSLGRLSVTRSYRNSTLFDRTSGTEQLHCSNSVKLSVQLLQYHGLTASLWPVQSCLL